MLHFLTSTFLAFFLYHPEHHFASPLPPSPQFVGVVTTDGFYIVEEGKQAVMMLDASVLDYPRYPTICWDKKKSRFLIATGSRIFSHSVNPHTMQPTGFAELTPSYPANAYYIDIEVDKKGNVFVLDGENNCIRRFADIPTDYTPVPALVATCVYPVSRESTAFDIVSNGRSPEFVVAQPFDVIQTSRGGDTIISYLYRATSVEASKRGQIFISESMVNDKIIKTSSNANSHEDLNWSLHCSKVLFNPQDIEWSNKKKSLLVLAEYGITSCAFLKVHGNNHIVSLHEKWTSGYSLFTSRMGSGITGEEGDIAIVQ